MSGLGGSGGGQTSYQLNPDVAVPGMLADQNFDDKIVSYVAGEYIEFGRVCEVDANGLVYHTAGTGAALTTTNRQLAGVTIFDAAREQQLATFGGTSVGSTGQAGYQVGEPVPVLRKGRIFGCWDGGTGSFTQGVLVRPNINHPSTTDPNDLRGSFTGNATSNTAGSEVAQAPAEMLLVRDVSTLTPQRGGASAGSLGPTYVCLVEVNLPGA